MQNAPPPEKNYRFPLTIFGNCNREETENFTEEEKKLHEAQLFYCNCEIEQSKKMLVELLSSTTNIYIKIGTLYFLCFTYLHTREFQNVEEALFSIRLLFESDFEHKNELTFILEDLLVTFDREKAGYSPLDLNMLGVNSKTADVFISLLETCKTLTENLTEGSLINTNIFELICRMFELNKYEIASMYMHHYIGIMNQLNKKTNEAKNHFRKAIEIAIKTNCYAPLLGLSFANFELYDEILSEFPNKAAFLRKNHQKFLNDYSKYLNHEGKSSYYKSLSTEDFKYINYVLFQVPNKTIAAKENISEGTVNNRFNVLYDKLDVQGKKALHKLIVSTILDKSE